VYESDVTIIVNVRERFGLTQASLESLYQTMGGNYPLIYVDVNSPRKVQRYVQRAAAERKFDLVRVDENISPNHARNIGFKRAKTKYVVFVDNDVFMAPDWLRPLVECAEATGAWAVGPLYMERGGAAAAQSGQYMASPEDLVHMAGGEIVIKGEWGRRECIQTQRHFRKKLGEMQRNYTREKCDLIEFHCALIRRDAFEKVGGLDEKLMTTREHIDFCLRIREAGGTVYFEPRSVITYATPPPFALSDLPYFLLRWSDTWTHATLSHFAEKYGLDPVYVDRVKKTTERRQALLAQPLLARAEKLFGPRGGQVVKKAVEVLEPKANAVLVKALSPASYRSMLHD